MILIGYFFVNIHLSIAEYLHIVNSPKYRFYYLPPSPEGHGLEIIKYLLYVRLCVHLFVTYLYEP